MNKITTKSKTFHGTKKKRKPRFFRKRFILSALAQIGETTLSNFFNALSGVGDFSEKMLLPYHDSYNALRIGRSGVRRDSLFDDEAERRRSKAILVNLLSKLSKEGLVERAEDGKIIITSKGLECAEIKSPTPPWFKTYKLSSKPNKSSSFKLIIFDIPEKDRIQRDWLRFKLKQFGFRQMQMSVWWGRGSLPEEFIADLEKYTILPHVHILAVSKKGTISTFLKQIGEV